IHQVNSQSFQPAAQFNALLQIPSALFPIGRRYAHQERERLWQRLANYLCYAQQKPDAILKAAAIVVLAVVAQRRIELVQQIAMGRMNPTNWKPAARARRVACWK